MLFTISQILLLSVTDSSSLSQFFFSINYPLLHHVLFKRRRRQPLLWNFLRYSMQINKPKRHYTFRCGTFERANLRLRQIKIQVNNEEDICQRT